MAEIMIWTYWSGFFASLIFSIVLMGWAVANRKDLGVDVFTLMIGILILSAFSWFFIILVISILIFEYIKDRK